MRVVRQVAVALLAAALLTGTSGAALAAELPDDDFTIVYAGTVESRFQGSTDTSAKRLTLTCSGGTCRADWPALKRAFPLGPDGQYQVTESNKVSDGACGGVVATGTTKLSATSTTLRITTTSPAASKRCSTGGWNLPASASSFVGTAVEGPAGDETGDETGTGDSDSDDGGASEAESGGGGATQGSRDGGTTSRLDSGSAAAPSVLSALPTVSEAAPTGRQSLLIAALVVILVLLIAFPTHLLNTAVDTAQVSAATWWRRRRGATETAPARMSGWTKTAVTVLAASLISSFVDPEFGLNAGSLRTLASIAVSLAIESVLVWLTVIWVVRRLAPTVSASFEVAPSTLVVVVAAVALTRLTGFEPAIVFGLVAGVAFGAATSTAVEGRIVLAGAGLALALALAGWVAYSLIDAGPDAGVATVLASETFSSLAIAGIASLPIALVPLRGLAGHTLYAWKPLLWAASYAVGLVGFFLVLMPMPFSWAGVDLSLATWVGLYLAYAAVAVVAWLWVVRPWRAEVAAAP